MDFKADLYADWDKRAGAIFDRLHAIASTQSIRIRFESKAAMRKSYKDLIKLGRLKPFLARTKASLYQQVLNNRESFIILSPNIRLEFIVNGRLGYWNGFGASIDYARQLRLAEMGADWLLKMASPVWLSINLGLHYEPFIGFLEGLSAKGIQSSD